MKNLILKFTVLSLFASMTYAQEKITISSFIGVEIGGDIGQYEQTLRLSRNDTRKMYMDEVVQTAVKLGQGVFNPAPLIGPLQRLQEAADQRRDINKLIDESGIGFSAGELIRAEIEKIYRDYGITSAERKIEFANPFPRINGRVMYNSKVVFDHYIFMVITHVGGGDFNITGTLGTLGGSRNGIERTFSGSGSIITAIRKLAEDIFTAVAENNRPAWKNPNPQLIWIPGPASMDNLTSQEAKAFCTGQNARLPFAEELILAHHGSSFRKGGVSRLKTGEAYYVGDQRRQKAVTMIVLMAPEGIKVQAQNGYTGKVWCVKGDLNERNTLIKRLFEIRRDADPKGMNIYYFGKELKEDKLTTVRAVESLLISLGAADAKLDSTIGYSDYIEPKEALRILNRMGHNISVSEKILATLE
jgi:hypothetical protein